MKRRTIAAVITVVPLVLSLGAWSSAPSQLSSSSSSLPSPSEKTPPTVDAAANLPETFDLQSHRGGRGEWTEESARAFEESLALGATTLEFDIVLSEDNVPVVWHDPSIQEDKCSDTAPATTDDPEFPYVGDLVHELSWAQLQTLNCDKVLPGYPDAEAVEGNKLIQLRDVFDIAEGTDVHFNIETKIEGENRADSATPAEFVDAIVPVVQEYGVEKRTMIQSFDWRTLPLVREQEPEIPLAILWDDSTWKSGSLWTGEVDYDSVTGDIFAAADQLDVEVLSPGYAQPYGTSAGDADYNPVATPEFVATAHERGYAVAPWTINDAATMREQIEAGVDGIITDYPSTLAAVLDEMGIEY